jgi:hypothetical protein
VPAACADLILRSNTEDALAHQYNLGQREYERILDASGQVTVVSGIASLLYFLSRSTKVAEGLFIYTLKHIEYIMLNEIFGIFSLRLWSTGFSNFV